MWKETLDFDLRVHDKFTPVKTLVNGFVGVVNVGLDDQLVRQPYVAGESVWLWTVGLESGSALRRGIDDEWTGLTFGTSPQIHDIERSSWRTYENYTGPLGLQTLTDITGNHYGVNVEASERNGWGQWHRADDKGVGMDRTVAHRHTGIHRPISSPELHACIGFRWSPCPDDLLLFMHHVRPTRTILHSGKTVIQSIYDSHYEGAEAAGRTTPASGEALKGLVDEQRYHGEVLAQLEYQAGQAEVWRDAVTNWFLRASGIPDEKGRVGHYPGRVEAESMRLQGYTVRDVTPAEDASGGKAVTCAVAQCTASFAYDGAAGWYTMRVEYFDQYSLQNKGAAHYQV